MVIYFNMLLSLMDYVMQQSGRAGRNGQKNREISKVKQNLGVHTYAVGMTLTAAQYYDIRDRLGALLRKRIKSVRLLTVDEAKALEEGKPA